VELAPLGRPDHRACQVMWEMPGPLAQLEPLVRQVPMGRLGRRETLGLGLVEELGPPEPRAPSS